MGGSIRKKVLGEHIVPVLRRCLILALCLFWAGSSAAAEEAGDAMGQDAAQQESSVVARVNGTIITRREFVDQYWSAVRQKFYHRRPPETEMAAFRHELLNGMIERRLLESEIDRRGIKADEDAVQRRMKRVTARYEGSDIWEKEGKRLSRELHDVLAADDRIAKLRGEIEAQAALPDASRLKDYYQVNIRKFTTPPRLRVSLILIKVAPWEKTAVWDSARDEVASFREMISRGMDFAIIAKERSDDDSAVHGGDLGYLHGGMLSPEAEGVIDGLKVGEVSEPVRLLRGYALFRLDERQPEHVNAFADVEQRVRDMWLHEFRQKAWTDFVGGLRSAARIEIDENALNGSAL
ncbi:MAG: hypothetical protein GC138_02115 [Gammaproteobacteria bacterium]|nr:hypothetical protein [Gammaproteobacteria bacterium]